MKNLTIEYRKETFTLIFCLLSFLSLYGQPSDLPWDPDPECGTIATEGVVALSCGVLLDNPPETNFTFGMLNINGQLPASGRVDLSSTIDLYHHPSWQIDSLGNVFGITVDPSGNAYAAASSNYASAFLTNLAINRYGSIGGGAEDVSAAGTIYRIDAVTGQATVFAVLPQQAYNFQHVRCEGANILTDRNTGPGLGNLIYNDLTELFYVTNFEDGRIYRLDAFGNILDSYDPLNLDNGQVGTPELQEIMYGITLSEDKTQLFFGNCGDPDSNENTDIYAIDLQADGSFTGSVDNSSLPTGATWNNYIGTETKHFELFNIDFFDTKFISDLEFTSSGKLLVGTRTGCFGNIHSSFNHEGTTYFLEPDNNGLYNQMTTIYLTSAELPWNDYGGVAVYTPSDGSPDQFVFSASDILSDAAGPHGVIWMEEGTDYGTGPFPFTPVARTGIVGYGPPIIQGTDPKGMGGDVQVFGSQCSIACPSEVRGDDLAVCSTDSFNLDVSVSGGNAPLDVSWTDIDGNPVDPIGLNLPNNNCEPLVVAYIMTATCIEDSSMTYIDTTHITVLDANIENYVTGLSDECSVDIIIEPSCQNYLRLLDTIPAISLGDSGTVCINVAYIIDPSACEFEVCLDFNCPCDASCCPTEIEAIAPSMVCSDESFVLDFEVNGASNMLATWTDEMGNIVNPDDVFITHLDCAPRQFTYFLNAVCEDDPSVILTDSVLINVYTSDISSFITIDSDGLCQGDVIIDPACTSFIEFQSFPPGTAFPGDTLIVPVNLAQSGGIGCASLEVLIEINCPCTTDCCPQWIQAADDLSVCSGEPFDLEFDIDPFTDNSPFIIEWTDLLGNIINPNNLQVTNDDCAPMLNQFIVSAICVNFPNVIFDTLDVWVAGSDLSPFVTVEGDGCSIDIVVDPDCVDFIEVDDTNLPIINPGDLGVASIFLNHTADFDNCPSNTVEVDYNCPCIDIEIDLTESECSEDGTFMVTLNIDTTITEGTFTIFDTLNTSIGTFNYDELPIQLGSFSGDLTTSNFRFQDDLGTYCLKDFSVGPKECIVCGECIMPNVFTPNGDGTNDDFSIVCINTVEILEFRIFNRWGELVHDNVMPWNGMQDGELATSDVYIYHVVYNNGCEQNELNGDVTLIR